jgi:bifunctional UDP-N-acetylglucosamine pyrophosphorylase/glucosamine-1-phosphate N-acetyltransferase
MSITNAVILAAGKGTRMKSKRPKVLHSIAGKPMVSHVLAAVGEAVKREHVYIVTGYEAELVEAELGGAYTYVRQEKQLGTGHAVMAAKAHLSGRQGETLVLAGDTPLISGTTLNNLLAVHRQMQAAVTVLTAVVDDPAGYGRIIRNEQGLIKKIVEHKDAALDELKVREINAGIYCFDTEHLVEALGKISNQNAQGEYYLTDCIEIMSQKGETIAGYTVDDPDEIMGVNDRVALAQAERIMRRRINVRHMQNGVTLIDPDQTYIDQDVQIGRDTVIYPGTLLAGQTVIGEDCHIGPFTHLVNVKVHQGAQVVQSQARDAVIGARATVGPYAYLRPGTSVGDRCRIGHFVELKNSQIGPESKIPHLSYVGDATIGRRVNWGCGSITVNYDGVQKHRTIVEDDSFIGCNVNLVAPVHVGEGAYIAAGSTITRSVPPDSLAIARERETIKENYVSKRWKKEKNKN